MRYMPPEWAAHDATWMGFPSSAYDGAGVSTAEAQTAWAAVANTLVDHEPVRMLCHPQWLKQARKQLSGRVELVSYAIDDAWLRDTGPTFVLDDGNLLGVDWRFNGWGDNTQFDTSVDAGIARKICEYLDCGISPSTLTNEGGGIHVNGEGTVLLTRTVQLDPQRNAGWTATAVEQEIHHQLGTSYALWLDQGLYRDYLDHGTRGHVDIVACFTPAGQVLMHMQSNPEHPDHQRCQSFAKTLHDAGLDVVTIPAPVTLRDNRDWVDYSYLNHYVLNGAVLVPTFNDRNDTPVIELLSEYYPGRTVRGIDARVIFAQGGGVHCITQQQPAVAGL